MKAKRGKKKGVSDAGDRGGGGAGCAHHRPNNAEQKEVRAVRLGFVAAPPPPSFRRS